MTIKPVLSRVAVVLAACVVMAWAALSPAAAFEIRKVTSPGGITAWLVEDHTIPLITMKFSFTGGAAGDPKDKAGLAHFLSGMLDEGAGELSSQQFQRRVEDLAMRLSFDTDLDYFNVTFRTLTASRDDAFAMLKLALTQPRFDAKPLARVRQQLILARKRDLQDPSQIAVSAWMKALFGDHPYARRSKGTIETIKAITADDLRALTRRLFARDNLLIAVVGDIDEQTLKRLLDQTFAALPAKSSMPQVPEVKFPSGGHVEVIERNVPQSVIRFGHRGIKRSDPDFITAFVVNHILGSGSFGSRLMEEVREKRGLTYGIYTTFYPLLRGGAFFGGAATVNARAGETLKVTREVLARMATHGPTAEELAQAKTYLTGAYALRFDSGAKVAGQLLGIQQAGLGIDYVKTRNAKINAVTLAETRRVARRLLHPDNLIVTVVGKPKGIKTAGNSG